MTERWKGRTMVEASCATCRFRGQTYYRPADQSINLDSLTYACRRNAPVVTGGMMSPTMTVWPWVGAHQWCGQHEPVQEDAKALTGGVE